VSEGDRWQVTGDKISRHSSRVTRHARGGVGQVERQRRAQDQRGVAGERELRHQESVGTRSTRVPILPEAKFGTLWKASLPSLESVPEVSAKLKEPNTKEQKFEDVVKDAEQAAVLVY
jgi:hypothetical protein